MKRLTEIFFTLALTIILIFSQRAVRLSASEGTEITVTVGGATLNATLFDTALAREIQEHLPLKIPMRAYGEREYYGTINFTPQNLEGGRRDFEDGHIVYCPELHCIAVFYAQSSNPTLSVDIIPFGKITSGLSAFQDLPNSAEITFALAQ